METSLYVDITYIETCRRRQAQHMLGCKHCVKQALGSYNIHGTALPYIFRVFHLIS